MQWMDTYSEWVPVAGVALAALAALILLVKARRHGLYSAGRTISMALILAWEAQGLHGLALATGVDGVAAWVVALLTSVTLVTLAAGADQHHRRYGTLGWPGRLVWVVAVPMGAIVALSATGVAEAALRVALPTLAALVWWSKYAPVVVSGPTRREGAWRWTPRRIGVALGLLDPTDADLSQVHAERQIRRLTTAAHQLHHGWRRLRGWRAARLRRLALVATPDMVAEVQRRVTLVHDVERLTAPAAAFVADSSASLSTDQPVGDAPVDDKPASGVTTKRPARKRASTAERVARAVAKTPDASSAEIAARLRLSERTVQRYRSEMTPPLSTANGTGDTVPVEVSTGA